MSREELIEYFSFLADLRESGVTNMFGAPPFLEEAFALSKKDATKVFILWMKNFTREADVYEVVDKALATLTTN